MKTFTKKYQLWTFVDSAYTFEEFDTLQECIEAPKQGEWYITKKVSLSVTEAETEPYGKIPIPSPFDGKGSGHDKHSDLPSRGANPRPEPDRTPEEIAADDLAGRYAGGTIASLG